jgi:hypothetical protein
MSVPTHYDPVLKMIVEVSTRMADQTEGQVQAEITLNVGGFLVSGYITSARQFMLHHVLTDGLLEAAESEFKSAGMLSDDTFEYIHLSRAKFFVPGQPAIPGNVDGVFWRGRLSDISGFTFGVLGPPRDENA